MTKDRQTDIAVVRCSVSSHPKLWDIVICLCVCGWYACVVSDEMHGRQLIIGPSDVAAKLGDSVLLECAAKKYTHTADVSQITWTREGRRLFDYYLSGPKILMFL